MLVRRLEGSQFFLYDRVELELPAQGVVLVTGQNGAGKSAVYEMVAWALHGETVRGSKVKRGTVQLSFGEKGEEYTVARKRGRSTELTLKCGMLDLTQATPTETQRKVDELVGSHEQFCAGHVFARDLLAKFALATDKGRKGLLEELLGLQQFDRALVLARTDYAQEDVKVRVAEGRLPLLRERVERVRRQYEEVLKKTLDSSLPPVEALKDRLVAARAERAALGVESGKLAGHLGAVDVKLQEAREALHELMTRESGRGLTRASVERDIAAQNEGCPACGRPYDAVSKAAALAELEDRLAQLSVPAVPEKELAKARARFGNLAEERAEVLAARAANEARRNELVSEEGTLTRQVMELDGLMRRHDELAAELQQAGDDVRAVEKELAEATKARDLVDAACDVLGLKGARCLLLGRALTRLEQEANLVLAQVHPTLRLKVSGTTVRGDREVESVSVTVEGAGGGDYRGCSGGQRVLVDVALMLGLAALRGGDGLIVFDEVFDALDAERVEAVATYVQAMARERQVMVISHREDFAALFRAATRLRARLDEDGASVLEGA